MSHVRDKSRTMNANQFRTWKMITTQESDVFRGFIESEQAKNQSQHSE